MRLPWTPAETPADPAADATGPDAGPTPAKRPLYVRLLRLRHIRPNGWQRAALGEGALALAVVLVLADVASAWTLLVLPVSVAVVVKAHDVLAGWLGQPANGQSAADEAEAEDDPETTTAPDPEGTGAVGRRGS